MLKTHPDTQSGDKCGIILVLQLIGRYLPKIRQTVCAVCDRPYILEMTGFFVHWHVHVRCILAHIKNNTEGLVVSSHGKKIRSEFLRLWRRHCLWHCTVTWAGIACIYTAAVCAFYKHWSNLSFAHRNALGIQTLSLQNGSHAFYIRINSTVGKTLSTSFRLMNLNLRGCFCRSNATG